MKCLKRSAVNPGGVSTGALRRQEGGRAGYFQLFLFFATTILLLERYINEQCPKQQTDKKNKTKQTELSGMTKSRWTAPQDPSRSNKHQFQQEGLKEGKGYGFLYRGCI